MSLITTAVIPLVLVAVLLAACFTLPSSKTVTRSAVIHAGAEAIYPVIVSSRGFQRFNPYHDADPDLKIQFFGPESGIGAGFAFDGKEGKGKQTIIAAEENRQIQMEIDLGAMGKPIQTFRLEEHNGATRVTWSTHSNFGNNPIGRVFGLFLDKMLGKNYERGLDNLANEVLAS